MEKHEARQYKALYFDLCVKELKKHFSYSNPTGAYHKIKDYLSCHNFSHEQYSGYHSNYKTTDLEIFDLVREMGRTFCWLQKSLNHFEVTNIGANHDLMCIFTDGIEEVPIEHLRKYP